MLRGKLNCIGENHTHEKLIAPFDSKVEVRIVDPGRGLYNNSYMDSFL